MTGALHPLENHCLVLFSSASVFFIVTVARTAAFPPGAGAGNVADQCIVPYLKSVLAVVSMTNMATICYNSKSKLATYNKL